MCVFNHQFYKMETQHKTLKTVFQSTFIHEMHIAKATLENEGVKRFVIDEHLSYSIGTAFIEEYKLMINEQDFDKALIILSLNKT